MKYVPPYGRETEGDSAQYVNGDPSTGIQGSIPPANAFEHPMREIVGVVDKSVIEPSELDLLQMAKAIRSQRMNYAEDTGSVNTLSVAFDPPLPNYTIGLPIRVKVANTNTGPSTIDAGAGRASIRKPNGAEVGAGNLPAAGMIDLVYDGTVWQLINFGGIADSGGGDTEIFQVYIPYTVDTSPTANTIIADFSPALESIVPGTIIMVKVANTNTSFTNINCNGLGLKPISAQGSLAPWTILPCDVVAGDVVILVFDGTQFWFSANDILNISAAFNVANNADFDKLFVALGRKRIFKNIQLDIILATGVWGPIHTEHPNSDQITVRGTMLAAAPHFADFHKTGSGNSHTSDANNNIFMLRSRFGTEIRCVGTDYGIVHSGGGMMTFRNLLVTGQNSLIPITSHLIHPDAGTSTLFLNVVTWGAHNGSWTASGCAMKCIECFACNNWNEGWLANVGASILVQESGAYGNTAGFRCYMQGNITLDRNPGRPGNESISNRQGVVASDASMIYVYYSTLVGNGDYDAGAYAGSTVVLSGSSWSWTTPYINTVGNSNAIVVGT